MKDKRVRVTIDVMVNLPDEDDVLDILNDYFSPGADGPVEIISTEYDVQE